MEEHPTCKLRTYHMEWPDLDITVTSTWACGYALRTIHRRDEMPEASIRAQHEEAHRIQHVRHGAGLRLPLP